MIFELHPPHSAGPLVIGAIANHTVEVLRTLGDPQILCKTPEGPVAWGLFRSSGMFISTHFDAGRLEAVEFGRPHDTSDAVTYKGTDVFTTPAAGVVAHLRRHTTVSDEENGHVFTAYCLVLSFWRPVTQDSTEDDDGRFFESVLISRPGYHDNRAEARCRTEK